MGFEEVDVVVGQIDVALVLGDDAAVVVEHRLRVVLEQLPAVVWTTDVSLGYTSITGAACRALGIDPYEVVGIAIAEHQLDPAAADAHRTALAGTAAQYDLQWGSRTLQAHVEPLRRGDGDVVGESDGETLGLVGESGCGKSTLGKSIARLYEPTGGSIKFEGNELAGLSRRQLKPFRREIQMIFQDPYESLNPRQTVASIVEEPFIIHKMGTGEERRKWVAELLDQVGLPSVAAQRYPFEFSGGQRQRIGIARALALKPQLIICDEPVSALDVSIQSQILNLLMDLQRNLGLSYLFISHDMAVVERVSHRIAVMYKGELVERGLPSDVFANPTHPYTRALIAAIPVVTDAEEAMKPKVTPEEKQRFLVSSAA